MRKLSLTFSSTRRYTNEGQSGTAIACGCQNQTNQGPIPAQLGQGDSPLSPGLFHFLWKGPDCMCFRLCGHKVCIAATNLCHESAKAATVNDWAQLYSHKTLFTRIVGREEFGHGLWFVNSYFNLSLKVTGTFQVTFTSM